MYVPRDRTATELLADGTPQEAIDEANDVRLGFEPPAPLMVRVTYADTARRTVPFADIAFGDEWTGAHGPVRTVTPVRVRRDDGGFPHHTRLSRSLSGKPIYGTGRVRP